MKSFEGYVIKENPLRYEVKYTELKENLQVYICEEKVKRCKCGEKLVVLNYDTHRNGIGKEFHGKKCPSCGKNYFLRKVYSCNSEVFEILGVIDNRTIDNDISSEESLENLRFYMINPEEKQCRKCGGSIEKYKKRIATSTGKRIRLAIRKCVDCGCYHLTYSSYSIHKECDIKIVNSYEIEKMRLASDLRRVIKNKKRELEELENQFRTLVDIEECSKDTKETRTNIGNDFSVYVYFKLNNFCIRNNHNIQSVTMEVKNTKSNDRKAVNVFFCKQCNKYWINYEAVEKLISEKFYPEIKYKIVDESWDGLKPVSKLMLYGYNVKEGNLSEFQRQELLSNIIDKGLMTKEEIIRNIQTKIDFNGKKKGNEHAKEKWQADIKFISQYTVGNRRKITGQLYRKSKAIVD